MDIRRAYLRRSIKQARLQKRLAAAAMLAAAGCAAWVLQLQAPRPQQDPMSAATPGAALASPAALRPAAKPAPAPRRVYPYSIVPGGVSSRAELARAVMADKVVAAHYVDFAVDKAALRTVAKPRAVYVSYRKGEQVFWTAHKVTLAEGESVLSDGVNDIRTRCGNRISDTPRLPVEAKGPAEKELDTPFEQFSEGDGKLINTSFVLEDLDAGGSAEQAAPAPQSFPNGAGLLAAARPQASLASFASGSAGWERMDLPSLPASGYRPAGFTRLADQAPGPAAGTASSSTGSATPDTGTVPATVPAAGSSGGNVGNPGTPDNTGGTATNGSGGGGGSTTGGDTGGKPGAGNPEQPPPATLRPDGLPNGTQPAKTNEVPEPGGLWLTGAALAALLLQRRLRARRPR